MGIARTSNPWTQNVIVNWSFAECDLLLEIYTKRLMVPIYYNVAKNEVQRIGNVYSY